MAEPLIFTEVENAILLMSYDPTKEWGQTLPARELDPVAQEKEANRKEAIRVLDTLYDVDQEFRHIFLGLK